MGFRLNHPKAKSRLKNKPIHHMYFNAHARTHTCTHAHTHTHTHTVHTPPFHSQLLIHTYLKYTKDFVHDQNGVGDAAIVISDGVAHAHRENELDGAPNSQQDKDDRNSQQPRLYMEDSLLKNCFFNLPPCLYEQEKKSWNKDL